MWSLPVQPNDDDDDDDDDNDDGDDSDNEEIQATYWACCVECILFIQTSQAGETARTCFKSNLQL